MSGVWNDPIWESYLEHRDAARLGEEIATAPWGASRERAEESLLMRAVLAGDLAAVNAMLAAGESAERKATDGFSFLHCAVDVAAQARAQPERDDAIGILRALLMQGIDPNVQGIDGTPLHRAAGAGCIEAMKVLIEHSANVEARMLVDDEPTPVIHAAQMRQRAAVEFLVSLGIIEPEH